MRVIRKKEKGLKLYFARYVELVEGLLLAITGGFIKKRLGS